MCDILSVYKDSHLYHFFTKEVQYRSSIYLNAMIQKSQYLIGLDLIFRIIFFIILIQYRHYDNRNDFETYPVIFVSYFKANT